jgi:hypothetical protein
MDIIQTIALLCQLNGAGADSAHLIEYAEKKQLKCQQYYTKCLDPINSSYRTLSKCILDRKLDN